MRNSGAGVQEELGRVVARNLAWKLGVYWDVALSCGDPTIFSFIRVAFPHISLDRKSNNFFLTFSQSN